MPCKHNWTHYSALAVLISARYLLIFPCIYIYFISSIFIFILLVYLFIFNIYFFYFYSEVLQRWENGKTCRPDGLEAGSYRYARWRPMLDIKSSLCFPRQRQDSVAIRVSEQLHFGGHFSHERLEDSKIGEPKIAHRSIYGQCSVTDECPLCTRNISCWYVRTLVDNKSDCRPERRTALVTCQLKHYNIDKVALSDTRIGDGQLELDTTLFGSLKEERRKAGIGFTVRSDIGRTSRSYI